MSNQKEVVHILFCCRYPDDLGIRVKNQPGERIKDAMLDRFKPSPSERSLHSHPNKFQLRGEYAHRTHFSGLSDLLRAHGRDSAWIEEVHKPFFPDSPCGDG